MKQPCPVASYLGIGSELGFELEVLLKEDEEEIGVVDENVLLGLFATSGLGGFDLVARLAKACFFTYFICLKDLALFLYKRN